MLVTTLLFATLACLVSADWPKELEATVSDLRSRHRTRKVCPVIPDPDGGDDAPAIVQAFADCNNGGLVELSNTTYNIKTVMNTTELCDVIVDLKGTLLWDASDLPYWLNNSIPVGYQNQSTVWMFGGDRIVFEGHGYGTLDGNGDTWYSFVRGQSNYPGRPMAITPWKLTNSVFHGVRLVQSQMWTMAIMHSKNVLMRDIYVNSTSHSSQPARNTDGADSLFSDRIWFDKWTVDNGDDSISIKANSTNILISNCNFHRGLGVAIGSIGQYEGVFETIENVTATDIVFNKTRYAAYFKTWTGNKVGDPPNGGGGGLGYATNLAFANFDIGNTTNLFTIGQCTTFSGTTGDCNSSLFNLRNIQLTNWTGTASTSNVVELKCSKASPCSNIQTTNINVNSSQNDTVIDGYLCRNVASTVGFTCNK
ncbi:pectin lyase fold/virulence factor [Auriculariales sp. MPI-PUGE-AT-0066]|nr:pectin lyase fold/virulence factor [Auriculariales sp. MPI-PUGE-AT-0066]